MPTYYIGIFMAITACCTAIGYLFGYKLGALHLQEWKDLLDEQEKLHTEELKEAFAKKDVKDRTMWD